jgi:hypothetical protein
MERWNDGIMGNPGDIDCVLLGACRKAGGGCAKAGDGGAAGADGGEVRVRLTAPQVSRV